MILTFDIGNGSIVMCCVEEGKRRARFTLSSDKERKADEYSVLMELLARRAGIDLGAVTGAIIASVVPKLTAVISVPGEPHRSSPETASTSSRTVNAFMAFSKRDCFYCSFSRNTL